MRNRIVIVAASYHVSETEIMLAATRDAAVARNLVIVAVQHVPGSLEAPLAVQRHLSRGDVDGVVVLGIIERGETQHGLVIGMAAIQSLIDMQLKFDKPIGIGILGPGIQPSQIPSRLEKHAVAAVDAVAALLSA